MNFSQYVQRNQYVAPVSHRHLEALERADAAAKDVFEDKHTAYLAAGASEVEAIEWAMDDASFAYDEALDAA